MNKKAEKAVGIAKKPIQTRKGNSKTANKYEKFWPASNNLNAWA